MAELVPGQRFGTYTLAEPIGAGPGGWWWRVSRAGRPDRAMLVLPQVGPAAKARLQRVAQLHQVVENPAIVPVLDIVESEDNVGVLSQWVKGPVLEDWMGHNTMAPARSESWFRLLVEGVQQAHGVGLLHLDLSPSRVVVARGEDGKVRPRIIGFGIWAALEDEPMLLEERMPAELAPEQVRVEPPSRSTDLFFLGELFYVLLSGQHPFGDPDPARAQQKLLSGTVIPIRRLRPSSTPVQDEVVSCLLKPEAVDRLPDCQSIFDLLDGNVATAADLMPKPTAEELADWDDFMAEEPQSNTTFRRAKAHQIVEFDEESTPIRPVPPPQAKRRALVTDRPHTLVPTDFTEEDPLPIGLFDTEDPAPGRASLPPPQRAPVAPKQPRSHPPTIEVPSSSLSKATPTSARQRPSLAKPMPTLNAPSPSLKMPQASGPPRRAPSRPPAMGQVAATFHEDTTEPAARQGRGRSPRESAPFVSLTPRDEISSPLVVTPSLPPPPSRSTSPGPEPAWQAVPDQASLMVSLDHHADDRPRLPTPTPAPPAPKGPSKWKLRMRLVLVAMSAGLLVLLLGYIGIRMVPTLRAQLAQRQASVQPPVEEVVALAPEVVPVEVPPEQPPGEPAAPEQGAAEATAAPTEPVPAVVPATEPVAATPPPVTSAPSTAPLTIAERSRLPPDQSSPDWAPSDPNYDPARPPTAIVRNEQTGVPERPEPTIQRSSETTTKEVADPPPPPAPSMVQVQFAPGPEDAWLELGKKRYRSGDVPEGVYDIKAVFDGDEVLAGRADLQGAESVTVRCSAGFQRCRIAP